MVFKIFKIYHLFKQKDQAALGKIEGPMTIKMGEESQKIKSNLEIKYSGSTANVKINFDSSESMKQVLFRYGTQTNKRMADIKVTYNPNSDDWINGMLRFLFPSAIDTQISAVIGRNIQTEGHLKIKPQESSSRMLKYKFDLDRSSKNIKGNFAWDADRDQSKQISTDLTYQYVESNAALSVR